MRSGVSDPAILSIFLNVDDTLFNTPRQYSSDNDVFSSSYYSNTIASISSIAELIPISKYIIPADGILNENIQDLRIIIPPNNSLVFSLSSTGAMQAFDLSVIWTED